MDKQHARFVPGARARALRGAAVALIFLFAGSAVAQAQTRDYQLRWRVPADPDVSTYRVFVGQAPRAYGTPFPIEAPPADANGIAATLLTGLDATRDYYVAMTALDQAGNESVLSNEVRVAAVPCQISQCDDGNSCTIDSCGASACVHQTVADGTGCNDGDSTTFFDRCTAGVCTGQRPQCTSDAQCPDTDANVCTGGRRCQDFACVATAPLVCPAPTDPCRAANCNPVTGCGQVNAPNGTTCNDGDPLTTGDVCTAGMCSGRHECESNADCADPDANVCTGTPVCSGFRCVAGAPPTCGAPPVCGTAACDATSGCFVRYDPVGTACDDGDAATEDDVCVSAGVCAGEVPPPPPPPGDVCAEAFGPSTAQRVAFGERLDTEMTVVWDAPANPAGAEVRFRRSGTQQWFSLPGQVIRRDGCNATFSARLEGLRPLSGYDYAVSGAGATQPHWSSLKRFVTSPALGSDAFFRAVFVAGTGSPGAPGAAGAALVRDHVARIRPQVLLGGGGYAFSNDVIGAGLAPDADAAVSRWFEQMSPALAGSPFLPVLGDSEHASYWHGEQAAMYADRHPLPSANGAPAGTYSYDVANTHFLAIGAPTPGALSPDTSEGASQLAWIEQDLADARRRGVRWVVAYLHADVWSSEAGASIDDATRDALEGVFERHRVQVVLSGDGNSAERTWPLVNGSPVRRWYLTRDGVIYLRTGSGGRSTFGTWASPTPPDTTAMRNNTRATLVMLTVGGDKMLIISTLGIDLQTGKVVQLDRAIVY